MYFHVMSLSLGIEGRAAIEAIDACDRMLAQLADAIARHEYAASLARADWEGPHRDAFEDQFEQLQYHLRRDEGFVLRVQRVARENLLDAFEQLREMQAATSRPGGPW